MMIMMEQCFGTSNGIL